MGFQKRYLVSETEATEEGTTEPGRMDGEIVDYEWVSAYIDIDARRFFINGGYVEEMRKTKTGVIVCRSTRPDGSVRAIRFTPVKGES